jgi:hypothetical protein
MQDVTLIGIDLGKHSFHVHGQDQHGKALLRKKFSRKQLLEFLATFHTCTIAMEASFEIKEAPCTHEGFPGLTVQLPTGFATAYFG